MKNAFFTIICLLFLTSCGGYHSKQYSGSNLDKSAISIITTEDQFITIGGLDGRKIDLSSVSDISNILMWGKYPRTISILPGQHSFWPCYENPYERGCAEGWIDIETKAGQSYIIKHERATDNKKVINFWIENQDGNEKTIH